MKMLGDAEPAGNDGRGASVESMGARLSVGSAMGDSRMGSRVMPEGSSVTMDC